MKKIFPIFVYSMLISVYSYAQVPADSLKGTYAGTVYFKTLPTDSWTIVPETLFVTGVDSINCLVGVGLCAGAEMPLYSSYTFCNSPVQGNFYARFYDMDSLTAIADSNTITPPCIPTFSIRFYGKRIGSNYGLDINEIKYIEQLNVYPNPSNTIIYVESNKFDGDILLQITDADGQEITNVQMRKAIFKIDISDYKNGIYFINLKTANGSLTKKIVVQR